MSTSPTPAISRVLADRTIVELLYDPDGRTTALAAAAPSAAPSVHAKYALPDGEVLVPYTPSNNLLNSRCVLLPSALGKVSSKVDLLTDLKEFIRRYVSLSDVFEDIAAHYVLLSWVYDAFNEVPYLRFSGDYGSGKTRALLVLGSLAYKGFFASGASTPSPIFHVLHEFGGTLVLDEADLRFSDATADLVKILNNGTVKGLPVLRTMTNRHRELNPHAFRVFGPKIVAMRGSFGDDALESRFLTEDMNGCAMRPNVQIHLADTMKEEAQDLRNRLLSWRFAERHRVRIDPARAVESLSPRGNQMALPLLSIVDADDVRLAIAGRLAAVEARAIARRASRPHVTMAGVLDELFRQSPNVPVSAAARAFNERTNGVLPIKSAGHIIRRELGLATVKTRGVYVVSEAEREKVRELVRRFSPATSRTGEVADFAREARENAWVKDAPVNKSPV